MTFVVTHIDGQVLAAGEYATRSAAAAVRLGVLTLPNSRQGPDEMTVREITEMDRYVFAASNVAQTRGPCVLFYPRPSAALHEVRAMVMASVSLIALTKHR